MTPAKILADQFLNANVVNSREAGAFEAFVKHIQDDAIGDCIPQCDIEILKQIADDMYNDSALHSCETATEAYMQAKFFKLIALIKNLGAR